MRHFQYKQKTNLIRKYTFLFLLSNCVGSHKIPYFLSTEFVGYYEHMFGVFAPFLFLLNGWDSPI